MIVDPNNRYIAYIRDIQLNSVFQGALRLLMMQLSEIQNPTSGIFSVSLYGQFEPAFSKY